MLKKLLKAKQDIKMQLHLDADRELGAWEKTEWKIVKWLRVFTM